MPCFSLNDSGDPPLSLVIFQADREEGLIPARSDVIQNYQPETVTDTAVQIHQRQASQ